MARRRQAPQHTDAAEYKHVVLGLIFLKYISDSFEEGHAIRGAHEIEDEGEPFDEKMTRLVSELNGRFPESAKLEQAIKGNLKGLGYEA